MELLLDFEKFKQIVNKLPNTVPVLESKSDGFKHLYENVYLYLLNNDNTNEDLALYVNIDSFDFDDLVEINRFAEEQINGQKAPFFLMTGIFEKVLPKRKSVHFV